MEIIGTSGKQYDLSDGRWGVGYIDLDEFMSIVRSLSDLVNPIVQADYNNGEPFVPIVELAKIGTGYDYEMLR